MFPMTHAGGAPRWTFLTNHGHVLLCLAQAPELRLRDVAALVGVTERAVQRIVADLEEAGYLTRRRTGRQNAYRIDIDRPMRHPVEARQTVRALLALVGLSTHAGATAGARRRAARPAQTGKRARTS
jgi:DNA-binding Lrp family transcriptional regulator